MKPRFPASIWQSPRWPGWGVVLLYAFLCAMLARDLTPAAMFTWPGMEGTLHSRIATFTEPTSMQYRWFVPVVVEGLRRVLGTTEAFAHLLFAVFSMWLVMVSFHMLLRRRFSPLAAFCGAVLLLVVYVAVRPRKFFHPYDPLVTWCVILALECLFRRSVRGYVLTLAFMCLVKWHASGVLLVGLIPAWFFTAGISRRQAWLATLGGGVATLGVMLGVHLPLFGLDVLLDDPTTPYYANIQPDEFVRLLLTFSFFAFCVSYVLPGLAGVVWGYRRLESPWRVLLWYPAAIFVLALAANVVVWETRTYFHAYPVFLPFLLAALPGGLCRGSSDPALPLPAESSAPTPTGDAPASEAEAHGSDTL